MRNAAKAMYHGHPGRDTGWKPVILACALVLLCSFASARATNLPKTAELLPPGTVLLVDVDNFSQLKQQFEKTNLYKLYKDPAMAAFVDDFKAKLREKTSKTDNKIVSAIVDANLLPQDRVAFALVLNKQATDAGEPMVLFITQWGENTTKIKEVVDKTVRKAVEEGLYQRSEDYRGVSIKTIIAEGSARLGYGFSSKLSYCFIDDCLMGSEDIELLKFAIAHIKGASSPTLADDTDYSTVVAAIGPYHDIDFYVNIKKIIKTAIAEDSTGDVQSIIANLGLDNVVAVGCSLGLNRAGSSCCGKALVKIEGGKRGICKMLALETATFRAPQFIPASAYSVTFLNLNIRKAYDTLGNILTSFSPQSAAIMFTPLLPASPDGQPPLELKTDIIDHLGSQIIIAQSTSKPFSKDKMPTESLVALAVENRNALEKSLSRLHSQVAANTPDATRELLGHTIYLVSVPAVPFFPTGMTPMQGPPGPSALQIHKLAFTVTDTHLIFGTESTVERAIRTLGSTEAALVASAEWFNNAKSSIPSVAGLACLQDNVASSELFWWMMKESSKTKTSSILVGPNPALVFSQMGFDFNTLPEFDAVRKYFGSSAFYGASRPDGFLFEFKYLNPTGTD